MAVDTAAKRYAAVHVSQPWRGPATLPTGTIGQASRQSAAFMYSGILADAPAPEATGGQWLPHPVRRRRR